MLESIPLRVTMVARDARRCGIVADRRRQVDLLE